ncbi:unnamed protein product [Aphanomyces euteiches]
MARVWLDYEREIVENLLQERDVLIVLAKGLGLKMLMSRFMLLYCQPTNLTLCLNASDDADHYLDSLKAQGIVNLPQVITNKCTVQERKIMYKNGGCIFVTSRILVVDMLNHVIDIPMISGLLVCDAHKVTDTSIEAFIMRLFREVNRSGFVKAFSDDAVTFSAGYNKIEQVLKLLYVRKVLLYPRFHIAIGGCLEKRQPDVYEVEVPLSPLMMEMQQALLVSLEATLNELKRSSKDLDETDLTMQNALTKALDVIIKKQLNSIWHQLPAKTKQLCSDLTVLRHLLAYLTRYDAITHYSFLMTQKKQSGQQRVPSAWLVTEAADRLFIAAKKRLYHVQGNVKSDKAQKRNCKVILNLEINPKWEILQTTLKEIMAESPKIAVGGSTVLIMLRDDRTAAQLREFLFMGGTNMMKRRFGRYLKQKNETRASNLTTFNIEQQLLLELAADLAEEVEMPTTSNNGKRKIASTPVYTGSIELASFGMTLEEITFLSSQDGKKSKPSQRMTIMAPSSQIVLCTYAQAKKCTNILDDLHPAHVILYDPDASFIRELEVHNALLTGDEEIQIHFMVYENSAEQQAYLSEIKREKDAFERLIKQKEHMIIPLNVFDLPAHLKVKQTPKYSLDTRTGGRAKAHTVSNQIIIDVREFRSALPSMLHKDGFILHPVTIEVGDYILSPWMCVERKSISDLFGSFASGRLFNQAEMMGRHYKMPILLIEFTPDKPFSLQQVSEITSDIKSSNICSKISLLVLHFPQLRILWSRSPHATVELFKQVKRGQDDPNVETAVAVGSSGSTAGDNANAMDVLRKLPGITDHNYRRVASKVKNLVELSTKSLQELETLIGSSCAKKLHAFFNRNID